MTRTTNHTRDRRSAVDPGQLRAAFAGDILTPADGSRYDGARAVFSACSTAGPR